MKKSYWRGVASGFLLSVLAVGLLVSAAAAGRTVAVEDGVRVTVNGALFTPRDAKGRTLPLFSYNGAAYVPVRAICEAAGMAVDEDASGRTVAVTTAGRTEAADPGAYGYITAQRAREIALADAGVRSADAVFLKTRLEWENGLAEYEVEFYCGATEYDYDIDAVTGAIRSRDWDCEDFEIPGGSGGADGVITEVRARSIALAKAPAGAVVTKCKLDRDDGRLVYEVELRSGRTEYECDINAVTGVILDWEADYDD